MVPFELKLISGDSIFDQVVFAAIRSILVGESKTGEAFPSVRAPALDLTKKFGRLEAVEAPNYSAVKIPALAIYAIPDSGKPLPSWYDTNDAELMETLEESGRSGDDTRRNRFVALE